MTRSPLQSQLTILQNAINNWHTLHDNVSDLYTETLSQTGVSCSYVLYFIMQNMYPIRDAFTILKKRLKFYSKGLVTNYGEGGGATKREGGALKV